jgi:site-specific DNA recombinase
VRQREEIVKKYAHLGVAEDEIVWAEDLDVSAFHVPPMRRPELRKALLALPPGSNIMFYRLDRFVRRVFPDWSDTVAFAADGRHRLMSATEPIDLSDIMGQMAATLFAFVGEMESRNMGLRIANNRAYLRRIGRWSGGTIPYGRYPEAVEGKPGKYLVEDVMAHAIIVEAAARVLKGESVNAIADDLNVRGIATSLDRARELSGKPPMCACGHGKHDEPCEKAHKCRHRTWKQGRSYVKTHEFDECSEPCPAYVKLKWKRNSLEVILRSRALLGQVTQSGGRVLLDDQGEPVLFAPPLILPETYEDIQGALDKRAFRKVRTNSQSFLLGVAFCDCGNPYYRHVSGSTNSAGKYYLYDNYRERADTKHCGSPAIRANLLDALVSRELLVHVGEFEVLELVKSASAEAAARSAELKMIGMQLVQLTQDMYVKGTPGKDHMDKMLALQARHAELLAAEPAQPGAVLKPTGQTFRLRWEGMDILDRRMWMLEAGVRVTARRGRMPSYTMPEPPIVAAEVPRWIRAEDGDVYAVIMLGGMADLLRGMSALKRDSRWVRSHPGALRLRQE